MSITRRYAPRLGGALLGFALVVSLANVLAQEPDSIALAQRFVEVAQIDALAAFGLKLSVRADFSRGEVSRKVQDCVETIDARIFAPAIIGVYADRVPASQLKQGIAFYESEAGKNYARVNFLRTEQALGFPRSSPYPPASPEVEKAVREFLLTPLAREMTSPSSALEISTQQVLAPIAHRALERCGVVPMGKRKL